MALSDRGRNDFPIRLAVAIALLLAAPGCGGRTVPRPPAATGAVGADVAFFAIGDPQINIVRWGTAGTERTIELN